MRRGRRGFTLIELFYVAVVVVVLLFVGAFFVWIAVVLLACLAYQLYRRRRPGPGHEPV